MIEVYRALIPANKIINDNHGQHYRIMQSQLQFLSTQFEACLVASAKKLGYEIDLGKNGCPNVDPWCLGHSKLGPWDFCIPPVEAIKLAGVDTSKFFTIRCETWRCRELRFDSQNYAKTYKAMIDMLTKHHYIPDDDWKHVDGIFFTGGGSSAWKTKAFRYKNDNLPENLGPDEWHMISNDYNDLLIRLIIHQ